jgi:hypothetical protein
VGFAEDVTSLTERLAGWVSPGKPPLPVIIGAGAIAAGEAVVVGEGVVVTVVRSSGATIA